MKIKINWGTAMVIAMVLFMVFILQFVYRTIAIDKYEHQLVSEDYYKDELYYQQEIDKMNNASKLVQNVKIDRAEGGMLIIFPDDMDFSKIIGTISFQRPSNKNLDFEQNIALSNNKLLISHNNLVEGKWKIKIDWKYNDEEYLLKETTFY